MKTFGNLVSYDIYFNDYNKGWVVGWQRSDDENHKWRYNLVQLSYQELVNY